MQKKHPLIHRRSFLFGLSGIATLGAVLTNRYVHKYEQIQSLYHPQRDFTVSSTVSLKKLAASKGLIYGSASRQINLALDPLYAATFVQNCQMIVPEWEFKWTAGNVTLRPGPDQFDFTAADWIANFATSHNLFLRGHTLVWHSSLPKWFIETANSQNAGELLKKHIQIFVHRYAGKIHSWDVVNEVIDPGDGRDDGLRITPWLQHLGANYIDLAFHLTAAVDPKALLVYNEYGLDYDNQQSDAKRTAVLKLLERLRSRGVPIHALGIQAHLSPGENKFNPQKLRKFLTDVASLGLKILITEMDVVDQELPRDYLIRDNMIAGIYEDYLSTVLDERAVIALLTWGLSDRYTWLSEFEPRPDGAPVRPLPLDAQMHPKLAWNAIARAIDHAPWR